MSVRKIYSMPRKQVNTLKKYDHGCVYEMNWNIIGNESDTKKKVNISKPLIIIVLDDIELESVHTSSSSGSGSSRAGTGTLGLRVERAPRTGGHRAALRDRGGRDRHAARLCAQQGGGVWGRGGERGRTWFGHGSNMGSNMGSGMSRGWGRVAVNHELRAVEKISGD